MLKLVKGDRTCKTLRLCNVSSTLFQYILYIYSNRQTELVLFRYLSFATIPQPVYFNWHPNVNRISLFVHCTVHSQIYKYTHSQYLNGASICLFTELSQSVGSVRWVSRGKDCVFIRSTHPRRNAYTEIHFTGI